MSHLTGPQFQKSKLQSLMAKLGLISVATVVPQAFWVAQTSAAVLEEVVVSASRKEQSVQDAPAVIAVIGADEIAKQRLGDLTDVTLAVPGLSFDGSHKDQNRLGMRGAFSSADTPSAGQAVGLYIDGVYYGRGAGMGPVLFDMEQIEVLKGPQGTLYGPNVVGGLINIQTKDPSLEESELSVQATAGNFGAREVAARLSVPVSDDLAFSLSMMKSDSDGWVKNLVTGNMLDQTDTLSIRGKLLILPDERTRVEAFFDTWQDDSYGEVRHVYATFGQPERFDVVGSAEQTYINDDAQYDRDSFTLGVEVTRELSDSVTLKSITAYSDTDSLGEDLPFLTGVTEGINATRNSQIEFFSQEILLFGESDRLEWQVGAYYYDDESSTDELFESTQVVDSPVVAFFEYPEYFETGFLMDSQTTSLSVFGQVTYAVTDWMNLTAGIRYLDEEKDSVTESYGDVFGGNYVAEELFSLSQSGSWTVNTPKLGIDMHWSDVGAFDEVMVYASVTKGFKSGDFVKGTTESTSLGTTEPEEVWNYEAGIKTTFLSGLANANLTVFQADYQDLQSQVQDEQAFVYLVTNDAEASGVEVELNLAPVEGLSISLTYAYLDTEITGDEPIGFDEDDDGNPVPIVVQGNLLPRSPENSFGLSVGYEWTVGSVDMELFAAYTQQDEAYISILNELPDNVLSLTEQELLNADLTMTMDRWQVSLWGKNLTDEAIVYEGQDLTNFWGLSNDQFEAGDTDLWNVRFSKPRTYGVTVRYEF
jgi:iron complex outermembrane receptor protein